MDKPPLFPEPEVDASQRAILCWCGESGHLDPDQLSNHLCETGFAGLVKELLASGAATAWTCRDGASAAVLEGWRESVARHRRFAERRAVAQAVAAALAEQREDAGAQAMAVDRLINPADRAGERPRAVKDLGRWR